MIVMSKKPTIIEVDDYLRDNKDEYIEKDGIFKGCLGDFKNGTTEYLDENWDIKTVEKLILNEYETQSIGFSTWQEFKSNFRNTWNRYFFQFKQNIENSLKEFPLYDYKRTSEYNRENTQNSTSTYERGTDGEMTTNGNSTEKYSNTPNEYIANKDNYNGLTSINEDTNNSTTTQNYSSNGTMGENTTREDTENATVTRTNNAFEKWLELSLKNRNIVYDFIDKFSWLFSRTTIFTSF